MINDANELIYKTNKLKRLRELTYGDEQGKNAGKGQLGSLG